MAKKNEHRQEHLSTRRGPYKSFFFYFDKPYKKLEQSVRRNEIIAYDLIEKKRVVFPYNHWKLNHKKAFRTSEAARILNRDKSKLYAWLREGVIPKPYRIEPKAKHAHLKMPPSAKYLWQEEDFRNAVEYMKTTKHFRSAPTWDEVSAHLNEDETIRFVQDENGNFIPIWKAD